MRNFCWLMYLSLSTASVAHGAVYQVGPFSGEINEGYEAFTTGFKNNDLGTTSYLEIAGGQALHRNNTANRIFVNDETPLGGMGSDFGPGGAAVGEQYVRITTVEDILLLPGKVQRFGGHFYSDWDTPIEVRMQGRQGINDIYLGSVFVTPTVGQWTWFGFESDDAGISLVAFEMQSGGAFGLDEFTADPVPEPATMVAFGLGLAATFRRRKNG